MAEHCCQHKAKELEKLQKRKGASPEFDSGACVARQSKVLWIILIINAVMFVVEFGGGIKAASLSLTGDSLDMLGDALVYGCSLYVIQKGKKAQARSPLKILKKLYKRFCSGTYSQSPPSNSYSD